MYDLSCIFVKKCLYFLWLDTFWKDLHKRGRVHFNFLSALRREAWGLEKNPTHGVIHSRWP